MIPNRLLKILHSCENAETSHFPPTEVFNEGWMLRLVLDAVQTLELADSPLRFLDRSRWYSEALLASRFKPRSRGDRLGEGFTNADAVIGHFAFDPSSKAGLQLLGDAKQFVVVEAKMFSNLSAGTTNAKIFDQAVRNIACMAHAIAVSGKGIDEFERLAFFVIAPKLERRKHRNTNLERCMDRISIRRNLSQRIAAYEIAADEEVSRNHAVGLRTWEADHFLPLVERLVSTNCVCVLSWEDCITAISERDELTGKELDSFYGRCLKYDPLPVYFAPPSPK